MELLRKAYLFTNDLVLRNVTTKTKIAKMTPIIKCSDETSVAKAAECLMNGQVISIPTDTIYGLACSANCPEAIKKLYSIKGRDAAKPVAICVSYIKDVRKWGEADHLSDELLHKLLPGPVTVVLEKTNLLNNPFLNPQTTKIGIRIPKREFVNNVTRLFDMPVALTSANFSNEPSTLCVKEFQHLYEHLGAVFDGGVLSVLEEHRAGSTVIDLSRKGVYKIVRYGISCENVVSMLEEHGLSCL